MKLDECLPLIGCCCGLANEMSACRFGLVSTVRRSLIGRRWLGSPPITVDCHLLISSLIGCHHPLQIMRAKIDGHSYSVVNQMACFFLHLLSIDFLSIDY